MGRLAGLPDRVVERAKEILENLEAGEWSADRVPARGEGELAPEGVRGVAEQMTLFERTSIEYQWIAELRRLDLNALTPREALALLYDWQEIIE